ncbi:MAG TPA: bifunctional adenosylcobinamide kinase/adenosylcobinamide-phosphate guanylyltransferase [Acidobacteriaceae bacterium]|jgi:adenosylcobinamide kinase/adenosylcobinamide-phosphate guanylyltransferase|nr:bifunctional adenosylcobinamide kinase/adenosylcobinamide-phosphate guanylyltransferase [Acidobacteriaceae bacterium]
MQGRHRNPVTLVLGGARSGKSRYAEKLASGAASVTYIATAQPCDDEMTEKIRLHREGRPKEWRTVEEPLALGPAVTGNSAISEYLIVDCLTIFAANLLEASGEDAALMEGGVAQLLEALGSPACPVVLVSNEVGSGVVPAYALGRRYRDLLGAVNQRVAACADNVLLMVAGLPLVLKGEAGVRL